MKNIITKTYDKIYENETEKGLYTIERGNVVQDCGRWFEKKTSKWYITLPEDHPSGRKLISESKIVEDSFEFEDKTSGPRVIGSWKSKLTKEEVEELEKLETRIEELKELGKSRIVKKPDLTTEEGILQEIKRLQSMIKK